MKSLLISFVLSLSLACATAQAPAPAKTIQCSGITAKGTQCTRKIASGTFCYQHLNSHDNSAKAAVAATGATSATGTQKVQCSGITAKGARCSRNAAANSTTCFQHSNQKTK